jgi:hypothetical protein
MALSVTVIRYSVLGLESQRPEGSFFTGCCGQVAERVSRSTSSSRDDGLRGLSSQRQEAVAA